MTTVDGNRSRRIEVVDIFVDGSGNHFARLEDGKEHPLIVDATYQRPLDQRKVDQIRADWDSIAADPVTFSTRRNGDLAIVNGQHEIVAALLEGEDCLWAEIFEGLTVAREADLRLKKNNQRPDTALEKFHARLAKEKGHPGPAMRIVSLLAEFGTYINQAPNSKQGINCVATVERLYGRQDGVVLRRTLKALQEAFGKDNLHGDVVTSAMLEGTAWFLTVHHGEYGWRKFVEQLRKFKPDGLGDMARGFKRAMGGADWLNLYRASVEAYNKGVRKADDKLEMRTSRWSAEVPANTLEKKRQLQAVA